MQSPQPRSRRYWPRFSIRTLLLAMLLLGVVLSWFVSQTRLAMQRQDVVNQIRALGGNVTYEYQMDSAGRRLPPPLPPILVQRVTGPLILSDVKKVTWQATRAADADTEGIKHLTKLEDLRLSSGGLTDEATRALSSLRRLHRLDLWCSQITDESMPRLGQLDALRQLDLYGTQVTDAGIQHLRGLMKLEELKLRNTRVTAAGAARLQNALPSCKILGVKGWPIRPESK